MATTFLVPKNNANSKLAADITAVATSLTVQSGEGARFPSTYPFNISIDNEILKVTNRSTDTMTVSRAQESTSAASHKAGANVQLNITAKAISDLNTAVNTAEAAIVALQAAPPAHGSSHENGGADEISVAGLSGLLADGQTPLAHATSHQDGGSDEISLAGLAGESVTPQPPKAHASSHQSGGSDAVKLDDLSAPDDNTDLDASIAKHGLLPKLANDAAKFLNGVGSFAVPAYSNPDKSARVYHDAAQSIPNATWTSLAFNSERFDTDVIHDTVTNNSRLTCKTAGKYLIIGLAFFASNGTGARHCKLTHNAATIIAYTTSNANAATGVIVAFSCIWDMAVNDYVEFAVYQDSGGALDVSSASALSPEFMMIKIA